VYRWVRVIERQKLEASLSEVDKVGTLMELNPLERGSSGRITRLEVKGTENTFVLSPELTIRRALGGSNSPLRSSCFVVDSYPDSQGVPVVFIFWGAGWGHGSGMCQVGAVGLADSGKTAADILAFYFPSTTLEARY
jgi:stage II sporulation protein D